MITYFHILLARARAPSQGRTHDFPIKIFSIRNHEPNLRTYFPSVVPPLSTLQWPCPWWPVGSGPQWSPVVSSGPGVICSTFIAPSSDTQPTPLHTTTQGYHGHMWGLGRQSFVFFIRCVPLVPVDLRQSPPAPVLAGVSGVQSTNKPPPGHCIINLLSTAPAAAFLVIKASESFVFERYF